MMKANIFISAIALMFQCATLVSAVPSIKGGGSGRTGTSTGAMLGGGSRGGTGGRGSGWRGGSTPGDPTPDAPLTGPTTPERMRGGDNPSTNSDASDPITPNTPRGANAPRGSSVPSALFRHPDFPVPIPVNAGNSGSGKHVGAYFPSYAQASHPYFSGNMSLYTEVYFPVASTTQTSAIALGQNGDLAEADVREFVATAKAAGTRPSCDRGWSGSIYFSPNVATASNRTAFANSLVEFYNKYRFEGINIDWEYPSMQGIGCNIVSPDDTANLVLFLQELRTLVPNATLSMTAAMTGIREGDGTTLTNLTPLANVVDYVSIMTYDAWGSWSRTTGPLAPLSDACATNGLAVKNAVDVFLMQNFTASQLVIGIPSYGRSYTTLNATLKETTFGTKSSLIYQEKSVDVPMGGATDDQPGTDVCGATTTYDGVWLVSELVEHGVLSADLSTAGNGYTRYFDECSGTPFLFNNETLSFIAYDDVESSVKKAEYAKSMGLKGIFFFDTAGALPDVVSSAAAAL